MARGAGRTCHEKDRSPRDRRVRGPRHADRDRCDGCDSRLRHGLDARRRGGPGIRRSLLREPGRARGHLDLLGPVRRREPATGECGVRLPVRPAGPQQAEGQHDQDRPVTGAGTRRRRRRTRGSCWSTPVARARPGSTWPLLGAYVPQHAGDTYDWIGFDPRGVGASKPALSCVPTYFGGNRPAYVPVDRRAGEDLAGRGPPATPGRARRTPPKLLPHMKTARQRPDMDAIRAALGAPKLSFYGFSYGTYLGQVYATLYPVTGAPDGARQQRRPARRVVPGEPAARTPPSS